MHRHDERVGQTIFNDGNCYEKKNIREGGYYGGKFKLWSRL